MIILTLIVAWLIFTFLVKVVRTTVSTAFVVAAIIVLLKVGFDISPFDIWNKILEFTQLAFQYINDADGKQLLPDFNKRN
ncbi:MAG: hypothetical protein AAF208_14790 [Cyanobacteria bacterium P01_A01_bin.45]